MPLYRIAPDRSSLDSVTVTTFAQEHIQERADLQRLLRANISALGEELLVVAEEYALFEDSRRRIDLLALDRSGTLTVIELKRTDDGGHMELQALRYAAMVSTMSYDQLVETHAHYNHLDLATARESLEEWLEESNGPQELPDHVRIILVSADFSTEVTSTVLWLNQQYSTDISCFRLRPYKLGAEVLLDIQQIVPLPEAADFQVQQRRKGATAAAARVASSTKDFTKYNLTVGQHQLSGQSKQAAVRQAVTLLAAQGVQQSLLREATHPKRWIPVTPEAGESVEEAFRREHPQRGDHYWFDLNLTEGNTAWVMPRLGGRHTEGCLTALAAIPGSTMTWAAVGAAEIAAPAGDPESPSDTPPEETSAAPPDNGLQAAGAAPAPGGVVQG